MFDAYALRIRKFGVGFEARWVPEVRIAGRYSDEHVREREARTVREALPDRCQVIALAPGGETLSTEEFAGRLERWSHPEAAFVVGGPLGLDRSFTQGAGIALSLSAMTLPHELARVVLAEQIFRALTILRGVPYHK